MNRANIQKLIDKISDEHTNFNMSVYYGYLGEEPRADTYPCGTPACVAGWANHLRIQEDPELKMRAYTPDGSSSVMLSDTHAAAEWMGVDVDPAQNLFVSTELNRHGALKVLRKWLEDGEATAPRDLHKQGFFNVVEDIRI